MLHTDPASGAGDALHSVRVQQTCATVQHMQAKPQWQQGGGKTVSLTSCTFGTAGQTQGLQALTLLNSSQSSSDSWDIRHRRSTQ